MNFAVIAIGCCLLAQAPSESDPFKPKLVPSRQPPAAIEPDVAPAAGHAGASPNNHLPAEPARPDRFESAPRVPLGESHGGTQSGAPHEAAAARGPAGADPAPPANLAPVGDVPRQRLRPPELLAEALTAPRETAAEGKPLTLITAIARTPDRQQQLRITKAYWRASTAQAAYNWAVHEQELVDRLTQQHANSAAAESAKAAAAADARDAQLDMAQAQQELADLLGAGGAELPMTVDRPHVGNYNTLYEDIFGNRAAPPRIRLIHRMLPIRRQAIDAHGAAIVAALDAVEVTSEDSHASVAGMPTVISLVEQLRHERRAFLTEIRDYNNDIAEYLLAVAKPGTSDQVLVSRLIFTGGKSAPTESPTVPREAAPPAGQAPATFEQTPQGPTAAGAQPQTSNDQPEATGGLMDDGGLYRGLTDFAAPTRVQKLSELLHWDRGLPSDSQQRVPLADVLRRVPAENRLALLALYWQTRERAAAYQVRNEQLEQLNTLSATMVAMRNHPGMATSGVRLQAVRRIAKAAAFDAHLALVQAEFDLTQAAGSSLAEPWLLPATPPQSGRYGVGREENMNGATQRLAEAVLGRHAELELRSDAVVRADELRATLGAVTRKAGEEQQASAAGGELMSPLDELIWAIGRQSGETLAFLENLTKYNLAIAHYALAISPRGILGDELVKRLVIARTAQGET